MSETKHTPGPWFDWDEREWLEEPQKLLTNYEDACLIAAAPEMFEALTQINAEMWLDPHLERLVRGAIAKATGEPNV